MSERRTRKKSFITLRQLLWTVLVALVSAYILITLAAMSMQAQTWLSAFFILVGYGLWAIRGSERIRLAIMVFSAMAALRYITWRTIYTLNLDNPIDGFFSTALFGAESYTVLMLVLFYFQTLSLERPADVAPPDPSFQPSVDIFIATYNESTDILRRTAGGALRMKYPNKKVYILDDGRRPEMRALAEEIGCEYLDRPDNKHAKAGNINHALPLSDGELILFLDADHIPVTTFLERTVHFFKDPEVCLVQTPHRFINPGPIERNLYLEGVIPGEQELFYQIVQPGKNLWNASFFCGSAAVWRRSVLLEVGGIATETVTEDCETCIKAHRLGYKSIFFGVPQVAGLSPESFSGYVIQQSRWARGSIQMLRLDFPLFMTDLTWPQRICYLAGMCHYLFGIPRLIYYSAPIVYLLFDIHPVRVSFVNYVIMAAPFLCLSFLANNYTFRNFRHSFWSDVYDATVAPFLAYYTTLALIDPKSGKFKVTPKGVLTNQLVFEYALAWPNMVILVGCVMAMLAGFLRYADTTSDIERHAIIINLAWNIYNMFVISSAVMSALERPFTRKAHRVQKELAVKVSANDGPVPALTEDISEFGAFIKVPLENPQRGDLVTISFAEQDVEPIDVRAVIRRSVKNERGEMMIGVEFLEEDAKRLSALIEMVYCDPDTWGVFREANDRLLRSLWLVLSTPARVYKQTIAWQKVQKKIQAQQAKGAAHGA